MQAGQTSDILWVYNSIQKRGFPEEILAVLSFIDRISEVKKNESLTAFFSLKGTEEFLLDHFPDFPVMPGVLQLESVKQAALALLSESEETAGRAYRINRVDGVRYGQFVKPGTLLKIFVRLARKEEDTYFFEGRIDLMKEGPPAEGGSASGGKGRVLLADFSMVPLN